MKFTTTIVVGVFALLGLIIVLYGALVLHGSNSANYVSFIAPVMTTLLALLVIAGKVDQVAEKTNTIERQTNGQMDAKFQTLKEHVTTETHAAADSAIQTIRESGDVG